MRKTHLATIVCLASSCSAIASPRLSSSLVASLEQRPWTLYISTSAIFDTNIERTPADMDSGGFVLGAGAFYRFPSEKPVFEARYEVANHNYSATDKYDRVSHDLSLLSRRPIGSKWSFETLAEASLKGSTEDRDVSDQYTLSPRLDYNPSKSKRIRLYGAVRRRNHPTDAGRDADNNFAGIELRHRLGGGKRVDVGYRQETNRARDNINDFDRSTIYFEYATPIGRDNLFSLEVRYKPRRFPNETVPSGSSRVDEDWVLAASWQRPLGHNRLLELGYRYEANDSNDPARDFTEHTGFVTLTQRW